MVDISKSFNPFLFSLQFSCWRKKVICPAVLQSGFCWLNLSWYHLTGFFVSCISSKEELDAGAWSGWDFWQECFLRGMRISIRRHKIFDCYLFVKLAVTEPGSINHQRVKWWQFIIPLYQLDYLRAYSKSNYNFVNHLTNSWSKT